MTRDGAGQIHANFGMGMGGGGAEFSDSAPNYSLNEPSCQRPAASRSPTLPAPSQPRVPQKMFAGSNPVFLWLSLHRLKGCRLQLGESNAGQLPRSVLLSWHPRLLHRGRSLANGWGCRVDWLPRTQNH